MHRRRKLHACFALLLLASIVYRPLAQAQTSYEATLAISVDQPRGIINRNIYGQFAEHLGRLIYEGIWVGEKLVNPEHARHAQRRARRVEGAARARPALARRLLR